MPSYRYEALDGDGRSRYGSIEALTPRAARDALRSQGSRAGGSRRGAGVIRSAIDTLASWPVRRRSEPGHAPARTLLTAGTPPRTVAAAIAQQAEKTATKRTLERVRAGVVAGQSLAQSMSADPNSFSALYRGLVAVGGETGQLAAVLARLADYLEARQALRQKIGLALIYPTLVAIIAAAVIAALMFYVVPQVGRGIPAVAADAAVADARADRIQRVRARDLAAVAGRPRVAAFGAGVFGWRNESIRARMQSFLLGVPGIGKLLTGLDTARFASTLAILVASGAPLIRALDAASGVLWLVRCAMRRMPSRSASSRASRCRGRWKRRRFFLRCSCIWSPAASPAAGCRRCSSGRARSRNAKSNASWHG
jgi:general secretion pathway protein F